MAGRWTVTGVSKSLEETMRELARTRTLKRLESIQGAADYVGCDPKTVRRWIAAGKITGYRAGARMIRVDLAELDAFLRPITSGGDAA